MLINAAYSCDFHFGFNYFYKGCFWFIEVVIYFTNLSIYNSVPPFDESIGIYNYHYWYFKGGGGGLPPIVLLSDMAIASGLVLEFVISEIRSSMW